MLTPIRALLSEPNVLFDNLAELLDKCNLIYNENRYHVKNLTSGNVIIHKRSPNDCWVNRYNRDLLRPLNSNIPESSHWQYMKKLMVN